MHTYNYGQRMMLCTLNVIVPAPLCSTAHWLYSTWPCICITQCWPAVMGVLYHHPELSRIST